MDAIDAPEGAIDVGDAVAARHPADQQRPPLGRLGGFRRDSAEIVRVEQGHLHLVRHAAGVGQVGLRRRLGGIEQEVADAKAGHRGKEELNLVGHRDEHQDVADEDLQRDPPGLREPPRSRAMSGPRRAHEAGPAVRCKRLVADADQYCGGDREHE